MMKLFHPTVPHSTYFQTEPTHNQSASRKNMMKSQKRIAAAAAKKSQYIEGNKEAVCGVSTKAVES